MGATRHIAGRPRVSPPRVARGRYGPHDAGRLTATGALLLLLAASPWAGAQPHRATLQLKWTADSSWEGDYFQKPFRFHVHEQLEGSLVFELAAPSVRVIQIREDGITLNAMLLEARGSSSYTADVRKEAGNCAPPGSDSTARAESAPFAGREEASAAWDARSPGQALIVFRRDEPVAIAISPKSMTARSRHQLLCPQPESVNRHHSYRMTARFGKALERPKPDSSGSGEAAGPWAVETTRTARGGYTTTARYSSVVRQRNPALDDPSAATGRLEVTKTFVFTWEAIPREE